MSTLVLPGLKVVLKNSGLTKQALADKADLDVQTIGRAARGNNVSETTAGLIAKALRVDIESLTSTPDNPRLVGPPRYAPAVWQQFKTDYRAMLGKNSIWGMAPIPFVVLVPLISDLLEAKPHPAFIVIHMLVAVLYIFLGSALFKNKNLMDLAGFQKYSPEFTLTNDQMDGHLRAYLEEQPLPLSQEDATHIENYLERRELVDLSSEETFEFSDEQMDLNERLEHDRQIIRGASKRILVVVCIAYFFAMSALLLF